MAARTSSSSLAMFLVVNILLFTITNACGSCPTPKPKPTPSPAVIPPAKCPKDTLKLGVCGDVLGLVSVVLGSPAVTPCCSLLSGLADLEAAVCLCTALKANILGVNLNVPISLTWLLNVCSKKAPSGFIC